MSVRVLLLCGGMSDEHEVSLASARSVLAATEGFSVTPVIITRGGSLLSPADSRELLAASGTVGGASETAPNALVELGREGVAAGLASAAGAFDVVFPLLHGPFGEDGRVQGLLDILGLPYVGSGVLGSASAMDKLTMKAVFAAHGLPQVRHVGVARHSWERDRGGVLANLKGLNYPLFVKPANLGSSIGVSVVTEESNLAASVEQALSYDRRVIVEEGALGARELEVGVLGNDAPQLSPVGEIRYAGSFYDYASKYTDGGAELLAPTSLPQKVSERVGTLALAAFQALDVAGLARVDFFYLEETGELLLNEINTMPGFTEHSMYPRLFAAGGVSYPGLISRLVELALERRS